MRTQTRREIAAIILRLPPPALPFNWTDPNAANLPMILPCRGRPAAALSFSCVHNLRRTASGPRSQRVNEAEAVAKSRASLAGVSAVGAGIRFNDMLANENMKRNLLATVGCTGVCLALALGHLHLSAAPPPATLLNDPVAVSQDFAALRSALGNMA